MIWVLIGAVSVFCFASMITSSAREPRAMDMAAWVLALIFVLIVAYGIGSAML
jgi:hypothetical protein